MLHLKIGENELTVKLVDKSTTKALKKLLADGPVTIHMDDFAGMEKGGKLPVSLPENNEPMNTRAGDVILYQGRTFVIYYGTNSWSLTPLGKIPGATKQGLLKILGSGSVDVTLSIQ